MASLKLLSLVSPNLNQYLQEVKADEAPSGVGEHFLSCRWHIWEQRSATKVTSSDYGEATQELASFYSIETFWNAWMAIPQPSIIMEHRGLWRMTNGKNVNQLDGLMVFREGIKPQWEDPQNRNGCHVQILYRLNDSEEKLCIDRDWNNLVIHTLGNIFPFSKDVTGVRLLDKLRAKLPSLRIEIWFSTSNLTDNKYKENVYRLLFGNNYTQENIQRLSSMTISIDVKSHSKMH